MMFGARLLQHRKSAGLSQEELSERSGVSVRAISDMERGRARSPQRRTTEALLDALDLDERARAELRRLARTGRVAPSSPVWSLPLYVADLVGREAELEAIAKKPNGLVVVHGAAGTGKTSLAVRAAHLLEDRFPDGQLFIDLEGSAQPLQRLLKDLGVPAEHVPEDANGQMRLYRSLLAGKRLLLVLDGARTEQEIRTLRADPGCLTIVTSQRRLAGLEGATWLRLGGLTEPCAVELLASIVGTHRVEADPETALRLVRLCGTSPLALRIAGNRLASRPRWPLSHLVEQIEERRLAALTAGDLDVRGAFEVSLAHLPDTARLVFRRLGLLIGTHVTPELAAELAGVTAGEAGQALEELTDVSLLDPDDRGYAMHGLVRTSAKGLIDATDDDADRRMLSWLLETTVAAGVLFGQTGDARRVSPRKAPFSDVTTGRRWLDEHRDLLPEIVTRAQARGLHDDVTRAVIALSHYAAIEPGLVWERVYRLALTSARLPWQEVVVLGQLGWVLFDVANRPGPALEVLTRAARVAGESGETGHLGWVWLIASAAHSGLGHFDEAERVCLEAIELMREPADEHYARSVLGVLWRLMDRPIAAVTAHEEVAKEQRAYAGTIYELSALGRTLGWLGLALIDVDRPDEAVEALTEAEDVYERAQMASWLARTLWHRALAHRAAGRLEESDGDLEQALTGFRALGDVLGEIEVLRALADNAQTRDDDNANLRYLRDSLVACERWDTDATREIAAEVRERMAAGQRRTVLRNASASNRSEPGGTSR
ncbi:helix-turn-helix domain-containing protein [Lentzea albida]|uniref:Transcriptional regulator, contains XRE-family HTH domain n=1 Tax=Lentzea albida TaxID=65499 RepID=A0A1H9VJT9_9PSEU|nr:helix-turn-helix domain-containing protein [Lentzea albida]SES21607.1 Transcriptional regulator, contains XRE-family HTH domain [Lentzea albida]